MNKTLIISSQMHEEIKRILGKACGKLIELEPNPNLPTPVAAHPDMQILIIDDTAVLTRGLYDTNSELRSKLCSDLTVRFAEHAHTGVYPGDVGLNALKIGKYLIAKSDSLDPEIKRLCVEKNIEIVNVKQGYAKCSTLALDNAVITADAGIAAAARGLGFDALMITPGGITLEGYDYGFIGGASYYDSESKTVYFFGDITQHPDSIRIVDFLHSHGVDICQSAACTLADFGGAVEV